MSTDPTPTPLDLEAIETALHTPGLDSWHTILTSIPALIAEVRRLRTESPAPDPDTLISVTASGWHVGNKAHIACLACGAHLTEERKGMRLPTGLYVGTDWPSHGLPAPALTSEVREAVAFLEAIFSKREDSNPVVAEFLAANAVAQDMGFTKWAANRALALLSPQVSTPPAPLTEGAPRREALIGFVLRYIGRANAAPYDSHYRDVAFHVDEFLKSGGGEAKTPWGDAASGWDSNQAAQALSNRLWEADSLIRANIGFLAAEADLIGIPASKRAWLWQANGYVKKREQDEKATERPAPGASPVPPVTPGIPGEGEHGQKGMGALVLVAILALLGLLVFFGKIALEEERRWQEYAAEHCKLKAHRKGRSFTTIGTDGNSHVTFESDQRTWVCDDGKEYTR